MRHVLTQAELARVKDTLRKAEAMVRARDAHAYTQVPIPPPDPGFHPEIGVTTSHDSGTW